MKNIESTNENIPNEGMTTATATKMHAILEIRSKKLVLFSRLKKRKRHYLEEEK